MKGDHSLPAPVCWLGGKSRLKNRIVKQIPEHKTYVEPFVGGGSIFFKKPLVDKNVINDKELIDFYKNLRDTDCNSIKKCDLPTNKKDFQKAVNKKNKNACDFLKVNKRSYACDMKSPCFNDAIVKDSTRGKAGIKTLTKSCNKYQEKLKKTKITNQDFQTVVKKHDSKDTFTYMDPPYPQTHKYNHHEVDPKDVCALAKKALGKVMISYNDIPEVREACKGLNIKKVDTNYEIQKATTNRGQKAKELLITNY